MLAVTQLLMRPTEIVGTADQIHARLQGLQTLGGMPTFARQRSQTFPLGTVGSGTVALGGRPRRFGSTQGAGATLKRSNSETLQM